MENRHLESLVYEVDDERRGTAVHVAIHPSNMEAVLVEDCCGNKLTSSLTQRRSRTGLKISQSRLCRALQASRPGWPLPAGPGRQMGAATKLWPDGPGC